jgi:hypothetical protein
MTNKLANIVDSSELINFTKMDEFLEFINQEPPSIFVEDYPFARDVKYIPIDKTELTLTKIFQDWYVEVLEVQQLLNAIAVTVRVYYWHPIKKDWRHQDGVGAVDVQTEKGKSASDLAAINSNAVMKALPSAKSFAIKDATDHIGKIFGRDINRNNTLDFSPSYGTDEVKQQQEAAKERLQKALEKAEDLKNARN